MLNANLQCNNLCMGFLSIVQRNSSGKLRKKENCIALKYKDGVRDKRPKDSHRF
jgi:hypothetical protein